MKATNNDGLIQPYLFFEGRCEEAIEFYKKTLGAEVQFMMRYKESPEPSAADCLSAGSENKIMHAQVRIGQTVVMMSDGRASGKPVFDGFSLSLTLPTTAEVERSFKALADGGQVGMPLAKTFFSANFGMVADRFGVKWMVLVQPTVQHGK
jgi:PhnB protein